MRHIGKIEVVLSSLLLLAAACGKPSGERSNTSQNPGTFGQVFTVSVSATPGGTITSISPDGQINCGAGPGASVCQASYPWSAVVKLNAAGAPGYRFEQWAGDCAGPDYCVLDTTTMGADKYVVAIFTPNTDPLLHPNFTSPTLHGPAYVNGSYECTKCHGTNLQGQGAAIGCATCHAVPTAHTAGSACSECHADVAAQWASSADLHAAAAADVLLNVDHDTNELLVDECLNCHTMFQRPLGIAHFVSPIDQVGPWALLPGASDWQGTRCEVCHDATSTEIGKLAKYGAILDGPFDPSYTAASALPQPSQSVFDLGTDTYLDTPYVSASVGVAAVKLCYTCHDPADQGGDPNNVVGGHDYGPQGGDSRAFVTSSHAGLTCIDCHPTHDFTPVNPDNRRSCGVSGCHDVSRAGTAPGVVHTNHIP